MTSREKVIQKAIEIVTTSPEGKRYSDLVREVSGTFPDIPVNTVHGSLRKFRTKLPEAIYQPSRGLYRAVRFQEEGEKQVIDVTENNENQKARAGDKKQIDELIAHLADIIQSSPDEDVISMLGDGIMQRLLEAIAKPKTNKAETIYEYILRNKHRLQLLSCIRLCIHLNYAVKGKVGARDVFVSPHHIQWFEDGVMFTQGEKQFEGLIGLYQHGKVKFGIARRDKRGGEMMGPDDFDFVDVDVLAKRSKQPSIPHAIGELDAAVSRLQSLLDSQEKDEAEYQKFLEENPWFLGAEYRHIQSHEAFDDANIPDFTGIRVRDAARDILEIKQPFLRLFRADGAFRSEFNDAWDQAERYLHFARTEPDYLYRKKGLRFENPKCFLIIGHGLSVDQRAQIRRKECMNTAITVLSYDDLMAVGRATVALLKDLKGKNEEARASTCKKDMRRKRSTNPRT